MRSNDSSDGITTGLQSPSEGLSSDAGPDEATPHSDQGSAPDQQRRQLRIRYSASRAHLIFRPLIRYIRSSLASCDQLNASFPLAQRRVHRNRERVAPAPPANDVRGAMQAEPHSETSSARTEAVPTTVTTTSASPLVDWGALHDWYHEIVNVGTTWRDVWNSLKPASPADMHGAEKSNPWHWIDLATFDKEIEEGRRLVRLALLKSTEDLLIRPKRPLISPDDMRFLFILLENPLLFPSTSPRSLLPARRQSSRHANKRQPSLRHSGESAGSIRRKAATRSPQTPQEKEYHVKILKRVLGMLVHAGVPHHKTLCAWFSHYTDLQLQRLVNIVSRFITIRLNRDEKRKQHKAKTDKGAPLNDFVPLLSNEGATPAQLHDAISRVHISKPSDPNPHETPAYIDDWQLHAASEAMALLFIANGSTPRTRRSRRSKGLPLSAFYNTFFDYTNMIADFEAWEARCEQYTVCRYSFLLSLFSKIKLLEFEAHRQMEEKARHAFFATMLTRTPESQYMVLKVRRDCLVEDSLTSVSRVIASGQEDIKKGLRIQFAGEEGVDAGGLRKEWFLLLTRDIFNPDHGECVQLRRGRVLRVPLTLPAAGLFLYDDDSQYAYFNPYCLESSEQFYLIGVCLGLAIYNSTILDVALPPFIFRKLLASTPRLLASPSTAASSRAFRPTLEDLAEIRPAVARGLQNLLDYEGDVSDLCLDFVIEYERYGERVMCLLCPEGDRRPVTNANRKEYVRLYVQHMLDESVARQYNPFRNGFFTVCAGNALHLFRPEEIELLVRGSDEPLDIDSLKNVATYAGFGSEPMQDRMVGWFWDFFACADAKAQRRILSFITGSDRIPATGTANLVIKVALLGDDARRYPVAHTCYNMIGLFRYPSRELLQEKLWRAVVDSQGFGLK
ncbi:putative E3 ubiquitin-protein ligase [Ascosphaera acerosa]|nr:putative E3 ubiquitin-protein ligase [Ascosphaera acerosa]